MNILSKAVFLALLLSLFSSKIVWADDTYMDALSSEAGKTSMKDIEKTANTNNTQKKSSPKEEESKPETKSSKADTNAETEEPNSDSSDADKLTDKVSLQLEKLLVGSNEGDIKQEDLATIVSDAVQSGHEIDSIHDAVTSAMTELRDKEGIDIKAEVLEFSIKSVNEIVEASKNVAEGNVEDPYIQSLRAEAESSNKPLTASTVSTDKDASDRSTKTASTNEASSSDKKDKIETATSSTDTESAKQEDKSTKTNSAHETKTRTIIVLQGESLSKIAEKIYGSSRKYTLLYEANKETLKNPNNIHIGQILKVPMLTKEEG